MNARVWPTVFACYPRGVPRTVPPLLFVLFVTPGCVNEPTTVIEAEPLEPPLARAQPDVTAEVDLPTGDPTEEKAPGLGRGPTADPGPGPVPRARGGGDRLLFHLGAGYGALGSIDLSSCRDAGLLPGYWHMRVTFRPSGRVAHASVESPTMPPPQALGCIGKELEGIALPRFDGDDVTLSKSFFVSPAPLPSGGANPEIEVRTPRLSPAPPEKSSPWLARTLSGAAEGDVLCSTVEKHSLKCVVASPGDWLLRGARGVDVKPGLGHSALFCD
ncbi:MAG: hypothetical protein ABSC94_10415 [Polyangiaceae bacterium]